MRPDPTLEQIWEVRRQISERFGHDPKKLVEYYIALERDEYADRLAKPVDSPAGARAEEVT
jgi:hypothetical protein